MPITRDYAKTEPSRAQIDAIAGPAVLEFGTPWCGHCIAAQPLIETAFATHAAPDMPHIKIEDGPGRALGRSYRVKLWPTLVFLRNGEEVARVVRPRDAEAIAQALSAIEPPRS